MPARFAHTSRRQPRQFAPAESFLGPAPLIEGEDRKAYEQLLKNVRTAIAPPNFLVDMMVSDIVAHTWNIARLRRYEVELSKKLDETEKIYHTDRLSELSIAMTRLQRVQQMIALDEKRRHKVFQQIEYLCTKFAKALRKAIAEARPEFCGARANNGEPRTDTTA
jgi:hypothetical protein